MSVSVDFKGKENVAVASSPVLCRPSAHKGPLEPPIQLPSFVLTFANCQIAPRLMYRGLARTWTSSPSRSTANRSSDSSRSPGTETTRLYR